MKTMSNFTGALIFILLTAFFHLSGQEKELQAYLTYTLFDNPGGKPYIETHLMIESATAVAKTLEDGKKQVAINVQYVFSRDGKVVQYDKYTFKSPVFEGELKNDENFLDQRRYALENGKYEFSIEISDANNPDGRKIVTDVPLVVDFPEGKISVSGIELIESILPADKNENMWTKAGHKLIPYMFSFYPNTVNKLTFYAEIYNTDKEAGEDFLLKYYVKDTDTRRIVPYLSKFEKMKAQTIIPVLRQFDISELPSGNYSLNIEVRNKENQLTGFNSIDIVRSNPAKDNLASLLSAANFATRIDDADELADILKSMMPIASEIEQKTILSLSRMKKVEEMQNFLYDFWFSRYGLKAEPEFNRYREMVVFVNDEFSTQTKKRL